MRYKTSSNQNHWSSFVFVGHALIFICFCLLWTDVLNCIGWCIYKIHMSVFWWYNTCWTARLDQIWKISQPENVIFCNFFLHKVCSPATFASQRNWSSSKHEHGQWVRERERERESSRGRRLQSLHHRVKAPWWKKVEADNHVLLLATNSTSLMPWGWTEHISTVHVETTIYTPIPHIAINSHILHLGDILLRKLLKLNYIKCL